MLWDGRGGRELARLAGRCRISVASSRIVCLVNATSLPLEICVQIQSSSNNVDLKCIPKELLAAAGVVGAVVIVQTGVEVDQSYRMIGIFCVLVGRKKACEKWLFVRARHLFLIH